MGIKAANGGMPARVRRRRIRRDVFDWSVVTWEIRKCGWGRFSLIKIINKGIDTKIYVVR